MNKLSCGVLISWSCWAQAIVWTQERRPTGETISVGQLQHKIPKAEKRAFQRARKLSRAGEHEKAIAELENLVQRDTELSGADTLLGVEYAVSGRFAEAEAILNRSLELEPASWGTHYNLGLILYIKGDLSGAEQSARRALQFSNQNPHVHLFLGYLLLRREETHAQGLEELEFAARSIRPARDFLRSLAAR
jgi:Flp pilus assembly protein TadD